MPPADPEEAVGPPPAASLSSRLASGAVWSSILRVLGMLGGFVAAAIAARVLDRSEFGAFALATSIATIGAVLARFGLPMALIRLVSEARALGDQGRVRAVIRLCVRMVAAGGVVVFVFLAFGGGQWLAETLFDSSSLSSVMVLVAAWTSIEAVRLVVSEAFRGLGDVRMSLLLGDNGRSVVTAVLFAALAAVNGVTTLRTAALVALAASGFVFVVAGVLLAARMRTITGPTASVAASIVLSIAIPLTVMDLTGLFVNQGDLWVVGAFRPDADVALYSAASRLALFFTLPLFVVNAVLAPMIAELWTRGETERLERLIRGAITAAAVPALLGFVVVALAGRTLLTLVFGSSDFGDAHTVLTILTAGVVYGVLAGSCNLALMMTGHHRDVAVVAVIVLVLTIGAEIVGVQVAGLTGVAVASAGGTVVQNTLLTIVARRRLGIWTTARPSLDAVRALRDL